MLLSVGPDVAPLTIVLALVTELIATFLGILELIKIHRITLLETPDDEMAPPNGQDDGLMLRFVLNPDYVPDENTESEFDHDDTEEDAE